MLLWGLMIFWYNCRDKDEGAAMDNVIDLSILRAEVIEKSPVLMLS